MNSCVTAKVNNHRINKHYFARVGIQFGAVTRPHEQDIAPETLLAGLKPLKHQEP